MDYHLIADIAMALGLVLAGVKFAAHRKALAELRDAIGHETKWRREDDDRTHERLVALRDEVESGFEALGLERRNGRPASGPSWFKPNAQQRDIAR